MVSEYGMEETHTSNDHRPAWVPVMCQYFSALAKDLDPPVSWPVEDLAIESKAARCSTTPTWRKPRPWLQRANVEPCFLKHIYCRTVLRWSGIYRKKNPKSGITISSDQKNGYAIQPFPCQPWLFLRRLLRLASFCCWTETLLSILQHPILFYNAIENVHSAFMFKAGSKFSSFFLLDMGKKRAALRFREDASWILRTPANWCPARRHAPSLAWSHRSSWAWLEFAWFFTRLRQLNANSRASSAREIECAILSVRTREATIAMNRMTLVCLPRSSADTRSPNWKFAPASWPWHGKIPAL